jgi:hypothetical protein
MEDQITGKPQLNDLRRMTADSGFGRVIALGDGDSFLESGSNSPCVVRMFRRNRYWVLFLARQMSRTMRNRHIQGIPQGDGSH